MGICTHKIVTTIYGPFNAKVATSGYNLIMESIWDGKRLREARESNEQSLCDVASNLGVWPYTVMRWEANKAIPRMKYWKKLAASYPTLTPSDWPAKEKHGFCRETGSA